jgi:hypothetical protein
MLLSGVTMNKCCLNTNSYSCFFLKSFFGLAAYLFSQPGMSQVPPATQDPLKSLQKFYLDNPEFNPQNLASLIDSIFHKDSEVHKRVKNRLRQNTEILSSGRKDLEALDAILLQVQTQTSRGNFENNSYGVSAQRNLLHLLGANTAVEIPFRKQVYVNIQHLQTSLKQGSALSNELRELLKKGLQTTQDFEKATELRNQLWFILDVKHGIEITREVQNTFSTLIEKMKPRERELFDLILKKPTTIQFYADFESQNIMSTFMNLARYTNELARRSESESSRQNKAEKEFLLTLSIQFKAWSQNFDTRSASMEREWNLFANTFAFPGEKSQNTNSDNTGEARTEATEISFEIKLPQDFIATAQEQHEIEKLSPQVIKRALDAGYWTIQKGKDQSLLDHPNLSLATDHPDFDSSNLENTERTPLVSVNDLYFFHETIRNAFVNFVASKVTVEKEKLELLPAAKILSLWAEAKFREPLTLIESQKPQIEKEAEALKKDLTPLLNAIDKMKKEINSQDLIDCQTQFEQDIQTALVENGLASEVFANVFDLSNSKDKIAYTLMFNLQLIEALTPELRNYMRSLETTQENSTLDPTLHLKAMRASFWAAAAFPSLDKALMPTVDTPPDEEPVSSAKLSTDFIGESLSVNLNWTENLDINKDGVVDDWDRMRALAAQGFLY